MENVEILCAGGVRLFFVSPEIRFVSDQIRNRVGFRGVASTGTPNEDIPEERPYEMIRI